MWRALRPLLAAAVVLLAAGCTQEPVDRSVSPAPTGAARAACDELMLALPSTIDGQTGLAHREGSFVVYGKRDPVVVRCGVGRPAAMEATSRCDVVNDIGWFTEEVRGALRFTTIGRSTYVEVTVPNRLAPQAEVLVDLSEAVRKVPEVKPCV